MTALKLKRRADGKVSLTLKANGDDLIHIPDPNLRPYRDGTNRARAWQVVSLMDGLSVRDGHLVLQMLEQGIQRANGRPLGWVADAVSDRFAEIHRRCDK